MAKIWRLDDKEIRAVKGPEPGKKVMRLNDGGGLFLRVTAHTDKKGVERVSKSWEFFFTMKNKTSCAGLGPFAEDRQAPGLSLKAARDKAYELRKLVEAGTNPVEDKRSRDAVLCCSRSGEVRGATWDEFRDLDGDRPMWVISKDKTKSGAEYRIPLSPAAVKLLKSLPHKAGENHVFFAPRGGEMSDMTLSKVMKTMHEAKAKKDGKGWIDPTSKRPAVPHGTCRSTPRQWFAELGVERDLAEMMLGHKVGSEVERAYQRSDMIERRRAVGLSWAAFCHGEAVADNVVSLRAGVA
ncbi:integrase family protein [Cereibacter azotoformans]|uniref:integrase family protein n=1 Tax=Cereibacter azotoformans TaxID=43057 RepID=UPI000C6DE864|nr:integrase family protein [Cereibacter azotoformans]